MWSYHPLLDILVTTREVTSFSMLRYCKGLYHNLLNALDTVLLPNCGYWGYHGKLQPLLNVLVFAWGSIALLWILWLLHGKLSPFGCLGTEWGTIVLFWMLWVLHGALLPYSGHSVYSMGSFLPLWLLYALHQKLSPASGICDYCMKIYYPLLDVLCSAC